MFKRKSVVLLMLVMLLVISACSSNNGNQETNNQSNQGSTSQPSQQGSSASEDDAEKPKLKVLQRWLAEDYNTYPVAKVLEEQTGYKVDYEMLPQENGQERLNLLLGSGEHYDAVSVSGISEFKAMFLDYARQGALLDLTPLIDEYGPNIKAGISEETWDAIRVDGKIFAIPTRTVEFVATGMMVRLDWLEKLDLDVPETLDDFVDVLRAFRDHDPGGNGNRNLPLVIKNDTPFVPSIAGAFGLVNDWNDHNGQLVSRAMDDGLPEYLTFMNDLLNQGLLDPEFAITTDATMKEKFSSGLSGFAPLHWADIPPITDTLLEIDPEARIVYIPALIGPDGKRGYSTGSGFDLITFVPRSSEHPEDVIKWINAKLETETLKLMALGEEGVHHTFEDGQYKPILPAFNDERNLANSYLTGLNEEVYPSYWQARVRKDMRLYEGWEYLNLLQPEETRVNDPLGLAPYLEEYNKNYQKLNVMLNDYIIKVMFGEEGLDSLDSFRDNYNAEGGAASASEINEWYSN